MSQWTDVLTPMRKAAFAKFAECGKDVQGAEGERLRRLAGPDGKQEYAGFIQQPQRCLLEVMEAFPSVHPPLGRLLILPKNLHDEILYFFMVPVNIMVF